MYTIITVICNGSLFYFPHQIYPNKPSPPMRRYFNSIHYVVSCYVILDSCYTIQSSHCPPLSNSFLHDFTRFTIQYIVAC